MSQSGSSRGSLKQADLKHKDSVDGSDSVRSGAVPSEASTTVPSNPSSLIKLQGFLEKQGDWWGTYNARYVKLYASGVFVHYLSETDDKPRAKTYLQGATVATEGSDQSHYYFAITMPGGAAKIHLRCESREARREWVSTIAEIAEAATSAAARKKEKSITQEGKSPEDRKKERAAKKEQQSPAAESPGNGASNAQPSPRSSKQMAPVLEQAVANAVSTGVLPVKPEPSPLDRPSRQPPDREMPRESSAYVSAEMAKAMGFELDAAREQKQGSQVRVQDALNTLMARTEELKKIRAEKATKTSALNMRLEALGHASRGLKAYEGELEVLEEESNVQKSSRASLEQSSRGVQARLKTEAAEAAERLQGPENSVARLEALNDQADAEAKLALQAAEEDVMNAKRDVAATSTLLKMQTSQLALLKKQHVNAEHERGLAAKVLESKEKLLAASTHEQASLQQALAASEIHLTELSERCSVLLRADAATIEGVKAGAKQLAKAEKHVKKLVRLQGDYLRSEESSAVRDILTGDVDRLGAELEAAEAAVRTLEARQMEAKAVEEREHDMRQSEIRQLKAEMAASQAVHQKKKVHTVQQKEAVIELERQTVKMKHLEVEHVECVAVLSAELSQQQKRETELQAALAKAETAVKAKVERMAELDADLKEAEAQRAFEIDSERRVLTQQRAYLKQLNETAESDESTISKEGTALVTNLLATASGSANARRIRVDQARCAAMAELEDVEQKLRGSEATAIAEVSVATEMVEAQKKELAQLQAHEDAFNPHAAPSREETLNM